MWDSKKYKQILNHIKEEGVFLGKEINSKEKIYDELAREIHVSRETVKSWTRPESRGPVDPEINSILEEIFEVEPGMLEKTDENCERKKQIRMSDVNKTAIFTVYQLMREYLCDTRQKDTKIFYEMKNQVQKQRILIPDQIYEDILDFITVFIAPLTENQASFNDDYTSDLGDDNGEKNEVRLKAVIEELDKFAFTKLHPYLV